MVIFSYAWRLVRPYVYSTDDYAALAERNPGDLTMGEFRTIIRNQVDAKALD